MESLGTGTGNLNITFQINSARVLNFVFRRYSAASGLYFDEDISGKTFAFFVKKNKGDRKKTFNLTLGNGITIPIYSTNELRVALSASNTNIDEGEYVWELRRTDLDAPYLSGLAYFTYDSPQ
jgi:hypothetical protein